MPLLVSFLVSSNGIALRDLFLHLVSYKKVTLYKTIVWIRIPYFLDKKLAHNVHPLEPIDHSTPQISHQCLCGGLWQRHTDGTLGILYIYMHFRETHLGRWRYISWDICVSHIQVLCLAMIVVRHKENITKHDAINSNSKRLDRLIPSEHDEISPTTGRRGLAFCLWTEVCVGSLYKFFLGCQTFFI